MPARLIIALPNRLLALALAEYVQAKDNDIAVCGIATDTAQIFGLLGKVNGNRLSVISNQSSVISNQLSVIGSKTEKQKPEHRSPITDYRNTGNLVLLYDPYLPGPGPEVMCCRLRREFPGIKVVLLKAHNANGRFNEAEKCKPAAVISSETSPEQLLDIIRKVTGNRYSVVSEQPVKPNTEYREADTEHPLSQRELEVAELVSRGFTTKLIADELHISFRTIEKHLENIKSKLNLSCKSQVATWFITKA